MRRSPVPTSALGFGPPQHRDLLAQVGLDRAASDIPGNRRARGLQAYAPALIASIWGLEW